METKVTNLARVWGKMSYWPNGATRSYAETPLTPARANITVSKMNGEDKLNQRNQNTHAGRCPNLSKSTLMPTTGRVVYIPAAA